MKQEDKKLLINDLCARLPYGVMIQEKCIEHDEIFLPHPENNRLVNIDIREDLVITNGGSRYYIEEIKPYLFPLSSMTEEQYDECTNMGYSVTERWWSMANYHQIDWLNKNHFDYRGLIENGLAIDATNLNIY